MWYGSHILRDVTPTAPGEVEFDRRLGKALRMARGGMTQTELGERTGFKQSAISDWELGNNAMSFDVVHRIEQALDLRAGRLLIAAGLVDMEGGVDAIALIQADERLSDRVKMILIDTYQEFIDRAKEPR